MVLLYLFSFFRTILIIIGVVFVLKLFGQMAIAKRNLREQEMGNEESRKSAELKDKSRKEFGKTTVSKIGKSNLDEDDFVDFEEID